MRNDMFFKIESGRIIFNIWSLKIEIYNFLWPTGVLYSWWTKSERFSYNHKFQRKFSRKKIENFITKNFKMSSFGNFNFFKSNSKIERELAIWKKTFFCLCVFYFSYCTSFEFFIFGNENDYNSSQSRLEHSTYENYKIFRDIIKKKKYSKILKIV
jgi:hypothetical protein